MFIIFGQGKSGEARKWRPTRQPLGWLRLRSTRDVALRPRAYREDAPSRRRFDRGAGAASTAYQRHLVAHGDVAALNDEAVQRQHALGATVDVARDLHVLNLRG